MSVARASLEYLHRNSGARIVFATHYHELTELEASLPGLKNAYMKVLDERGKLTFLYEMALGRSSKSFGIQVAELAGLPKPVVKQAWEILRVLESQGSGGPASPQLSLFAPIPDEPLTPAPSLNASHPFIEELQNLDPNTLRPIDALQKLAEWKERLQSEHK
jgi:DNA mismatch repair protein MutS